MWAVWVLLCAVCFTGSCAPTNYRDNLKHGQQLSIRLPIVAHRLEFSSGNEPEKITVWSNRASPKRGKVMGSVEDRHFIIRSVSFDDQGNYTVIDYFNKTVSVHLVTVTPRKSSPAHVVGETLTIPLGGLAKSDVSLRFSNDDVNHTLVKQGSPVGNALPEYLGRIQVTGNRFQLLRVDESDVGDYTLTDSEGRTVSIISMKLIDHHKKLSPLSALLLLLGIPAGVCCCYRERICRRQSKAGNKPNSTGNTAKFKGSITPPGPPPSYPESPAVPTPIYNPDYPSNGESTVHPLPLNPANPANPAQPPFTGPPAMNPNPVFNPDYNNQNPAYPPVPGFNPQWSDAPYNPPAPSGFVMYNALSPGPAHSDLSKVEVHGMEISASTSLLPSPQP